MEEYSLSEQNTHSIYAISGMGADERAYTAFQRSFPYPLRFIPWKDPQRAEPITAYTNRMVAPHVHPHDPVRICIGLSFGGVIGLEALKEGIFTHAILISSVKGREELPPVMNLLRAVPVYKAIPSKALKRIIIRSGLIPAGLRFENQHKFKEMFEQFSPYYFKWCIHQLVNLSNSGTLKNTYHIHGTHDEIFSVKYICGADLIPGGSHLMIITRARDVSLMVQNIVQRIIETETNISRV